MAAQRMAVPLTSPHGRRWTDNWSRLGITGSSPSAGTDGLIPDRSWGVWLAGALYWAMSPETVMAKNVARCPSGAGPLYGVC
jgi:hypothetical protein